MGKGHFGAVRRYFAAVSVIVFAAVACGIARGDALSDISPNPQNVSYGSTAIGTLKITTYQATSGTVKGTPVVGAGLVAEFTQRYMPTCNLNLQWIQAVIGGQGTIGQSDGGSIPYLDPYERDDNLPYYWTAAENSTFSATNPEGRLTATAQPGSRFSDFPSQPITNNNSITFETALVAVSPTNPLNLIWLAGFEWGYSIANNTSSVFTFGWTSGPGTSLVGPLQAWNGTKENYIGGSAYDSTTFNNAVGYNFVTAAAAPACPLPNSSIMIAFLLVGWGGSRAIRNRGSMAKAA